MTTVIVLREEAIESMQANISKQKLQNGTNMNREKMLKKGEYSISFSDARSKKKIRI